MENCKRVFLPPSSPLALLFLKKEKEKTETHSQLNLLVTAKPLLSHRFSVRPRFLVQMLPAQMSPLMMFLIPTLLTSQPSSTVARFPFFCVCVCVDEPRLKHSALTPAVSCLWTNKALICPGFTGPGCPGLDQCITVIFPTGRSV